MAELFACHNVVGFMLLAHVPYRYRPRLEVGNASEHYKVGLSHKALKSAKPPRQKIGNDLPSQIGQTG